MTEADHARFDEIPDAAARAVLLLSGGLDSAVCLGLAARAGRRIHALTADYGQRHRVEVRAAADLAARFRVERHVVVRLDLRAIGGSALTADLEVPKDGPSGGIPPTYVPARNTILLSLALGLAETVQAEEIWCGVNAVDYSGYPDCRPEFLEAFAQLCERATKAGVERGWRPRIVAPLLRRSKADIARLAVEVGLDAAATVSCYDPDEAGRACGLCDACRLRRKGFTEAGIADPTRYRPPQIESKPST